AAAKFPNGTCPSEYVDNVRRVLLGGFDVLDVKEQLPLHDVNDPIFSLSAGNLSGLRFLNLSGDVKCLCSANESITNFVAVAPRIKGHYTWRSRGSEPLSGELVVEGREATFTGRMRMRGTAVRSASLSFSHLTAVSVHVDSMSSFSVPGARIMALGNRAFNKAVRKTTRDVVSPALKRALQTVKQ
ncbi:unnamed protein product, partial [Ixodes hexagonus]